MYIHTYKPTHLGNKLLNINIIFMEKLLIGQHAIWLMYYYFIILTCSSFFLQLLAICSI